MVSKDKVLNAIEELLKGRSATKNFKENMAAKWAEKIEDEDGVEDFIKDREDVLLEACSEADRRVAAANEKSKTTETKTETKDEVKTDDGMPEWAKAFTKNIESLNDKINSFEANNKAKTIQEKFFSHKNVKGVNLPESVKSKYVPMSEDDFETAISSFETDFKPLIEANALSAYGNDKPASGSPNYNGSVKKISADQAKQIVKSMNN